VLAKASTIDDMMIDPDGSDDGMLYLDHRCEN
jgi:hypothetical protein